MISPRLRRVLLALIVLAGGATTAWAVWSLNSDSEAARLYTGSHACDWDDLPVSLPYERGGRRCVRESAVVVGKGTSRGKGGSGYYFVVATAHSRNEHARVGWSSSAHDFWRAHKVGDTLSVQRFIEPGMRLTNAITIVADDHQHVTTADHPDNTRRRNQVNILVGLAMIVAGIATLRSRQ